LPPVDQPNRRLRLLEQFRRSFDGNANGYRHSELMMITISESSWRSFENVRGAAHIPEIEPDAFLKTFVSCESGRAAGWTCRVRHTHNGQGRAPSKDAQPAPRRRPSRAPPPGPAPPAAQAHGGRSAQPDAGGRKVTFRYPPMHAKL
jgi:hypothetical protein